MNTLEKEIAGLPAPFHLLCSCLGSNSQGKEDAERIRKWSRTISDWHGFTALVDRHRANPLVHMRLQRVAADIVPDAVLQQLRLRREQNLRRVLGMTSELVRLLNLFTAESIPAIPLKGPVLALQLYGDIGLRQMRDLDVLVEPDKIDLADRLLQEQGYRPRNSLAALTPWQRRKYQVIAHHLEYIHNRTGIQVELHFKQGKRGLLEKDFKELWAGGRPIAFFGRELQTMGAESLLLYLCVHGGSHAWHRLFWLGDLARLIEKNPAFDWQRILTRAEQCCAARLVGQGTILAHLLLGAPLNGLVASLAARDSTVSRLAQTALHTIRRESVLPVAGLAGSLQRIRYVFDFAPSWRHKSRCLQKLATSRQDWELLRLPNGLFPLYFLLRPFLWLIRRKFIGRKAPSPCR